MVDTPMPPIELAERFALAALVGASDAFLVILALLGFVAATVYLV
jgi:hypothetical protein